MGAGTETLILRSLEVYGLVKPVAMIPFPYPCPQACSTHRPLLDGRDLVTVCILASVLSLLKASRLNLSLPILLAG